VVEDAAVKSLKELKSPQNIMEFKLLRVIKPAICGDAYDYSVYQKERGNFLIPLEVIYRNSLPEGSSVFRRLKDGSLKLEEIGLEKMPVPGQILDKPILDVSTKLETTDRYISWEEARRICNLSEEEMEEIKRITLVVNKLITEEAEKLGLFNEDGKVEFGFDEERNLILVDALGTLDECRFTYSGIPVSKEIARIYYRKTSWYSDVESAKKQDKINWKTLVKSSPEPLPKELADAISLVYKAYANELTGRNWFDCPPLKEILNSIKALI
jgi:phosphoribosylaminoimidazole-succinocarboxamide synthase